MKSKLRIFLPTLLVVLIGDLVTKTIVVSRLDPHVAHPVVGDFLRFTLSFNTGAAFGLSWFGASRWVYVILTAVILVILFSMLKDTPVSDRWQSAALGLIVGGALGNLYDRIRWERGVVDFIDVGVGMNRFWTFNIADSGITVGATMMILLFIVQGVRARQLEAK